MTEYKVKEISFYSWYRYIFSIFYLLSKAWQSSPFNSHNVRNSLTFLKQYVSRETNWNPKDQAYLYDHIIRLYIT